MISLFLLGISFVDLHSKRSAAEMWQLRNTEEAIHTIEHNWFCMGMGLALFIVGS